ncbi:hypothetical protein K439DRAFT_1622549 [Ramaria rubella]|nr:hypothetical protein K439DRAFT_1622549 [Ramaria rubella]
MILDFSFLIAVPLHTLPSPFPPLPIEIVRGILELAASKDSTTAYSLLLVSTDVRRWIHPIVYETIEIFGLRKMMDFAAIFSGQTLLATSVRNLLLYDDTTGNFVSQALDNDASFLPQILLLCRGVRRLAINYIRGVPIVDGLKPYELTVRRGIRGITLKSSPFDKVTHLHCRYEQLMPSFFSKLETSRLTHMCFTHHLDFPDQACQHAVEHMIMAPRLQVLIVEVAYQKWHKFEDPAVRRLLAENSDDRLFMRLSKYDTVRPFDNERIFGGSASQGNVWDITSDKDWRTREWDKESIFQAYSHVQDKSFL